MKLTRVAFLAWGVMCGCTSNHFTEFESPYHYPLASAGAKFATLPPTVQNTVRAQAGTSVIQDIDKITSSGRPVFIIRFREGVLYPPLYVALDGSVLNYDLSTAVGAAEARDTIGVVTGSTARLSLSEAPEAVLRTVRNQAPAAVIESIGRETWGTKPVYIIGFKEPAQPKLYIEADGTMRKMNPTP